MILADKIIQLRKKQGWTQEEFASRMKVSRQAVSKWEGAQAVPDLNKILQMSELFGVSTDALLKDEICPEALTQQDAAGGEAAEAEAAEYRQLSLEQARRFLELRQMAARYIPFSITLFVLALIVMIIVAGGADLGILPLPKEAGAALGLSLAAALSVPGVALLLFSYNRNKELSFVGRVPTETDYGADSLAKSKQEAYRDKAFRRSVTGVTLLILSLIPLFLTAFFDQPEISPLHEFYAILLVCLFFLVADSGIFILVYNGIIAASYDRLLARRTSPVSELDHQSVFYKLRTILWPATVIVYLIWSIPFSAWPVSWLVFPVAVYLYIIFTRLAKKEM